MLVILKLPLVGLFVSMLRIPYGYLAPAILIICLIGVFSLKASTFDLWLMLIAGMAGYLLRKFDFDLAPLLLAFVLDDRIEIGIRRSLTISDGDFAIFLKGPAAQFSLALLVACLVGVFALRAHHVLKGRGHAAA